MNKICPTMPTFEPQSSTDQSSLLCCCSLLSEELSSNEHLDDCELQLLGDDVGLFLIDDESSDTSSSGATAVDGAARDDARRRKHRESMARLRHKLRESITDLQMQERKLERKLRRVMALFEANGTEDPRQRMIRAYYELVREQLALHEEREGLEATQAKRDKYERLVLRELDRTYQTQEQPKDNQTAEA